MQKLRSDSENIVARPSSRQLAAGEGWTASDVVCGAGPRDSPFEEQHSRTAVAIVLKGTFQYRTATGGELMTPGSMLLGNAGDCFTCGHEHGTGDRCLSFSYSEEFCERTVNRAARSRFRAPRLAPVRALAPLVAKAAEFLGRSDPAALEELGIRVLAQAMQAENRTRPRAAVEEPSALARVTRVVRIIDHDPDVPHDLSSLARLTCLSPFHFLRVFEGLTGATPHQYLLRMRLRRAALRLRTERAPIVEIALGCGFGDVSNFNRAFRAEFGVSPRAYRALA